jgi:hypothetical protein
MGRFSRERKECNPKDVCRECGASLKGSHHHFYCNDCWLPKNLRYISEKKMSLQAKKFIRDNLRGGK